MQYLQPSFPVAVLHLPAMLMAVPQNYAPLLSGAKLRTMLVTLRAPNLHGHRRPLHVWYVVRVVSAASPPARPLVRAPPVELLLMPSPALMARLTALSRTARGAAVAITYLTLVVSLLTTCRVPLLALVLRPRQTLLSRPLPPSRLTVLPVGPFPSLLVSRPTPPSRDAVRPAVPLVLALTARPMALMAEVLPLVLGLRVCIALPSVVPFERLPVPTSQKLVLPSASWVLLSAPFAMLGIAVRL